MPDLASLYIKVDSSGVVTADRNLDKLTGSSRKAEKATDALRRGYEKLAATMKLMAWAAMAAGIAAVAFALKKSIEMSTLFERELANVSTLVNTNVVSMAKLRKEILALNPNLGSATELTKGLYQAISAGVDASKAVEFVGKAAMAAKAGLSDAFTAVDAGTTILNAFGMAIEEATFVYDLMFTTVKEGKTTFAELASAVGKISPIASAAGVSVTEMHAALATLTKGGFATTEASARLATALGTIIKPSAEAEELTAKLGLSFNATALRAKGLHGFLQDVQKATGGNVDQMAMLFGGMESLSVMLALTGKQSKEFTDILGRMGNVSGATQEAFDKQKVTLIALWDTFKNTVGRQAILLGEKLLPKLSELVVNMTKWVDTNQVLIDSEFTAWVEKTTLLIGPLVKAISGIAWFFNAVGVGLAQAAARAVGYEEGILSLQDAENKAKVLLEEKLRLEKELAEVKKRESEKAPAQAAVAVGAVKTVVVATKEQIDLMKEVAKLQEEFNDALILGGGTGSIVESQLREGVGDNLKKDPISDDYLDKLAEAASYYENLIGFEDTYHEKMLELIEARRVADIDAKIAVSAANKKAMQARNDLAENAYDLEISHIRKQWGGYSDMFEGLGQLYDEDSSQRKTLHDIAMAFQIAEQAMMLVTAVRAAVIAIANQGQGDPYTAFARVAAMTGMMAVTLAKAGMSFGGGGGGGGSVTAVPSSTVLGAVDGAQSESIKNSWELLEDTYDMQYRELSGIHREMKDLNNNITGLVSSILRTGGFGSMGIATGETIGSMEGLFKSVPVLGNLIGSFFGSVFGGGTETSITGTGITTGGASIGSLIGGGGIGGQQYSDVYTKTKGGWFRSDKESRYTAFQALDDNVSRILDKVFQNMSATLVELTLGLGTDMNATLNYVFSGAKINLAGMSGDEMNKALSEHFSAMGDNAVDALFGHILRSYQQVGEGMLETATRILIDKEVVLDTLEMTNQAFYGGTLSIIEFSEAIIRMAGDLDTLRESAESYYDKFFSDEEKQIRLQEQLTGILSDMNLVLPGTRAGYRNLVESLNLNTEAGQRAYVTLLKLAEGADDFYSGLEDAQQRLIDAQGEIVDEMQGYVNKLKSARESMRLEGAEAAAAVVANAKAMFNAVLIAARGGDFTGIADMGNTLSTLVASANSTAGFASRLDYERNYFQTLAAITELEELAGTQLTIEEQTRDILEEQLTKLTEIALTTVEALAVAREQQALAALQLESQRTLTAQAELAAVQSQLEATQAQLSQAQAQQDQGGSGNFFSKVFGAFGFASGGAFSHGRVIPFASGDIFSKPTLFPMANGMGLMGEAGSEAIMPLTRIGGKLGVRAIGADSPELLAEVRALRAEIRVGNFQMAKNTGKTAKILERFDDDGLPAERT